MSEIPDIPKQIRDPDARVNIRLFLTKHPLLTQVIMETPLGDRAERLISLAALGLFAERNAGTAYGSQVIQAVPKKQIQLAPVEENSGEPAQPRLSKDYTSALLEQLDE